MRSVKYPIAINQHDPKNTISSHKGANSLITIHTEAVKISVAKAINKALNAT